jgi:hypothetical protein
VVQGGAELGKVDRNPAQKGLDEPADQPRPIRRCGQPAKLGQAVRVEHLPCRLRRSRRSDRWLGGGLVEPARQHPPELAQQHGLGDVVVHAGGQAPGPFLR